MLNENVFTNAESLINSIGCEQCEVKRVKRDNGLIERKNVEGKVILTEDNRQVLFG